MSLRGILSQIQSQLDGWLPTSQQAVGGGCIASSHLLEGDGRRVFLKVMDPSHSFEAEAHGLQVLGVACTPPDAFVIPKVLAWGSHSDGSWLAMEALDTCPSFDQGKAGKALALLHTQHGEAFGFDGDNWIGATPQTNPRHDDWLDFLLEARIQPQLLLAANKGLDLSGVDELLQNLPRFFTGYEVKPSLCHGDLWSGNVCGLTDGRVAIFDPACYFGDPESDLAMTELFGGFSPEFYQQYGQVSPIHDGYSHRKRIYQLYHILNHFNLFGGSYGTQAQSLIHHLNDAVSVA